MSLPHGIGSGDTQIRKMEERIREEEARMRRMILKGSSTAELQEQAVSEGMLTLRMDGIVKIKKGVTTLEEVVKETAG